MSDDEVMRFEITDYDLNNEFNPVRSRKATKEHQIYGVWAKDSDDEENEDTVRRRARKPKDYSAPIGFVAGGVQQAGKKKPEETKEVESSEASTARPPLPADSSDEEEAPAPLESETAGIRRRGQGLRQPSLAGMGTWEKHTKGIGAKLLLQMGYEPGKGLGKSLQGISAPVEATVRKGRGAIGAYGPEKAALKAKKAEEERRLKDKEQDKDVNEKSYNWKKSHKGRYFYRDSADLIQEGKPTLHTVATNELSRVPVIDMTGKEKRVLSGYHALAATAPRFEHEPRRQCRHLDLSPLTHNLAVIVQACEQDIIQNARSLQSCSDELVVVQRELDSVADKLRAHDGTMEVVRAIRKRLDPLANQDVSLEVAYEVLAQVKEEYPLEYDIFGIGTTAGNIASPYVSALLAAWDPLQNPSEPLPIYKKWRGILTDEAYNSLLWQHFVPAFSNAVEAWNPRSPEAMLSCVLAWKPACPDWIVEALLNRYVVPRILNAVRSWDPTLDTLPLHHWVLPWHELAGAALGMSVYPWIRARLGSALAAWHPGDASARLLLAAWRGAWPAQALHALLQPHVIPALQAALRAQPVRLAGEHPAWNWCVEWLELVGSRELARMAARCLLPRWLAALAAWLNAAPQHSDVLHAYTSFKDTFPEEVLKEPEVRDAFRKALDMMNRSTELEHVAPPPAPPPAPRLTAPLPPPPPPPAPRISEIVSTTAQAGSFSELLEAKCLEKGITFVPAPGKSREGRPLYRIGQLQCYVLRNVIMYSEDGGRTFLPIGLDRLLAKVED